MILFLKDTSEIRDAILKHNKTKPQTECKKKPGKRTKIKKKRQSDFLVDLDTIDKNEFDIQSYDL